MRRGLFLALLAGVSASPAWSQDIATEGNIETDGQLVSNAATGTAPLAVSSTTLVPSLNADRVDGLEGADLALDVDLQSAEALLIALQAQVDTLGRSLVPRTGQTTCYDLVGDVIPCGTGIGQGQDGEFQLGVTWPNPRFTDNSDGTVTDNLTGLTWLQIADCFGLRSWEQALSDSNGLADPACGLSDGSSAGQWRLPNVRELLSLVHYGWDHSVVPNTAGTGNCDITAAEPGPCPFTGLHDNNWWSATSLAYAPAAVWMVHMGVGKFNDCPKDPTACLGYVWPVRGGQ